MFITEHPGVLYMAHRRILARLIVNTDIDFRIIQCLELFVRLHTFETGGQNACKNE